ncbi:MAG TPA: NAD-dependent epimerase/dehydratase family protein [Candidatus Margulisiibacteriota bacterium]|nr:NAD-dependent epimerase/dehydratase family protein [Candidatus Margulisiibacteriota bacterium]
MPKSLVTGGAGFIGSHVAEHLLGQGHRVTVVDDLSGGFEDNVAPGVELVTGSINDVDLVERLFSERRFDYVFHLAAYAAEGLSHFVKRFNYTNNLIGSVNLINASISRNVKCFIFASSIAVYGTSPRLPLDETTSPCPADPYGIAKLAVEQELRVSQTMFGLNYVVFRLHNVYGERQNIADKYRNVVGIFMNQVLQGKPMTIFGDGRQTRAFTYVADVVPVIAAAGEVAAAQNQVFNLGADAPCSLEDLARAVARAMGVAPQMVHLPPRNEVVHAYSSHHRVREVFGAPPLHALEEGLERMARWVKRHGARSTKPFNAIEVRKNFPAAWL